MSESSAAAQPERLAPHLPAKVAGKRAFWGKRAERSGAERSGVARAKALPPDRARQTFCC